LASRDTVVSWANYCADEAKKHADATNAASYAAARAAIAAYYAASATSAYAYAAATYAAATYAANAADWSKTRNEELERFLSKLVEMNKAE